MALDVKQLPRVQELHKNITKLPDRIQLTAKSLVDNFRRYERLTDRQMAFVESLIKQATDDPQRTYEEITKDYLPIPGFERVSQMLHTAKTKIKFPCIRLIASDGTKIQLRPAQKAGSVKITFTGSSARSLYIANEKIYPVIDPIINALREFAADPQTTATRYGLDMKSCCFCGLTLTEPGSKFIGYGPICAGNYGLPHPQNGDMPNWETEKWLAKLQQPQDGGTN